MNEREQKKEKFKQLQKEVAEGKNIIPGVHNYCDRWCERCKFTHKCTVAIVNSEMGFEDNPDIGIAMDDISLIFETTFEMLQEMAVKHNINLNELQEVEAIEYIPTQLENDANEYSVALYKWLKENATVFTEKLEKMQISGSKDVSTLLEALEIINYFEFFISVKISRACDQDPDDEILDDDGVPFPKDSDGSAKLAIISIDRIIAAFTALYKFVPELEDGILDYLSKFSSLKTRLLHQFPDAMSFKRPGFDD